MAGKIAESDLGSSPFKRIIGHNPGILEAWLALENQFKSHPTLNPDIFEQIRRVSAHELKCGY